jgi:hypothetical protein
MKKNNNIEKKSILSEVPKTRPFKIPDNYFENLETDILRRTTAKKRTLFLNTALFKYAAAIIILLIISSVVFFRQYQSNQNPHDTFSYIEEYIINDPKPYEDSYEYLKILVALQADESEITEISSRDQEDMLEDIPNESIIEYLIQESEIINFEL